MKIHYDFSWQPRNDIIVSWLPSITAFSRSFLYEGITPKERRKNIKGAFALQTVTNFFGVKSKVSFKFLSRNRNICT